MDPRDDSLQIVVLGLVVLRVVCRGEVVGIRPSALLFRFPGLRCWWHEEICIHDIVGVHAGVVYIVHLAVLQFIIIAFTLWGIQIDIAKGWTTFVVVVIVVVVFILLVGSRLACFCGEGIFIPIYIVFVAVGGLTLIVS